MDEPRINVPKILSEFEGTARVFPLPGIALFPDAFASLSVIEPKDVALVQDADPDDGLVATALLREGEGDLALYPSPIHPIVCLAKMLMCREGNDGHLDVLLYGLTRARITEELPPGNFRRAQVEILGDVFRPARADRVARRMRRALDLVPGKHHVIWRLREMAESLRGANGGAGLFADAVAQHSELPPPALYEVLAEADVLKRFNTLIRHLEKKAAEGAPPAAPVADPRLN